LETSVGTAMTFASYLLVNSSAIDVNVSPLLATNATFIFSAANFSAIALPIPILAHFKIDYFCFIVFSFYYLILLFYIYFFFYIMIIYLHYMQLMLYSSINQLTFLQSHSQSRFLLLLY